MKILILSNKVPFPAKDGSSIAMRSIAMGLAKNSAVVKVMCINTKKHFREPKLIEHHKPESIDLEYLYRDTSITPLNLLSNLFSNKAFHVSRFYFTAFAERLANELKQNTYDWVQLEGLPMSPYLPIIRKYSKAKVALRAHNVEHEIWERQAANEQNLLKKWYLNLQVSRLKKLEIHISKHVDAIVSITEKDGQGFAKWSQSQKIQSIPCGLNEQEYQKLQPQPKYDLGYIASFDWMPNQQGMHWFYDEVWPKIKTLESNTTMALAGRYFPSSFSEFEKGGISLLGEVESVSEFLSQCRLIVIPLLAGSGMRIKILENMAFGLPMISTEVGAEGIALKNGEDIVLTNQAHTFANQTIALLNNPAQLEKMSHSVRQVFLKNYTNQALGKNLLDFYGKC